VPCAQCLDQAGPPRAPLRRCHDMPAHFSAICSSIIAYLDRLLQIQIASVS
jgi:hypothetical protein